MSVFFHLACFSKYTRVVAMDEQHSINKYMTFYLSIHHWWTFGLSLLWDYYERCCVNIYVQVLMWTYFQFSWEYTWPQNCCVTQVTLWWPSEALPRTFPSCTLPFTAPRAVRGVPISPYSPTPAIICLLYYKSPQLVERNTSLWF